MFQLDPSKRLNEFMNLTFAEQQRLKQRVGALEATLGLMRAGRQPRMPVEFKAQFGEDALLWEFFRDQWDGYFIEVGAFDGYEYSVSYAFECIGWSGLLVEAIPERYTECAARRTGSRVVHAALSCRGSRGTVDFTVTDDYLGGMFSYLDPGSEHAKKAASMSRRTVKVPTTTLNDLLAQHTGEIDFAVIDVEGAELLLLDGFDLERHRPKVIVIEDNNQEPDPELTAFMERAQYTEMARLRVNRVFVRPDLRPAWKRRFDF